MRAAEWARRHGPAELLALIGKGTISGSIAKQVLERMLETGDSAGAIVEREGLKQESDSGAIEAAVDKVLADKEMLTAILTEHVVGEKLDPMTLAGEHDSLNPKQGITVEGSGENFTVNGDAKVLCGNVQTANATVYIIDTVLLPKS